nr:hypothetical protein [Gammaproteobacteria bacterium]
MTRIPFYALLSMVLHLAAIWLVQGQWSAHAGLRHPPVLSQAMLVTLAQLPAPASESAPALAKAVPEAPRRESPRAPARPIARAEPQAKASPPKARPGTAEPAPPRPETLAAARPALQAGESRQAVASPPAPQEIFSRAPSFLESPRPPIYPSQARRRNQQGVVLVEVCLDDRGAQRELKVLRSSGVESLDRAALEAVSRWRFRPETLNGRTVPSRVHIPIEFALTASR